MIEHRFFPPLPLSLSLSLLSLSRSLMSLEYHVQNRPGDAPQQRRDDGFHVRRRRRRRASSIPSRRRQRHVTFVSMRAPGVVFRQSACFGQKARTKMEDKNELEKKVATEKRGLEY